jgi:hypothetical protein
MHESHKGREDKESPKVCILLKSCESFYTCPRAPFYRKTKGLLHSEITLESREYSWCERIHERLLHPVICGANFIHSTSSHIKPELLRWHLWLGLPLTPEAPFMKIITCRNSRTETPQDSRNSQVPDFLNFARLQSSWNRQQTWELKPIRL